MVLVQVNLDNEENKLVKLYQVKQDLKYKRDAIKSIIRLYAKSPATGQVCGSEGHLER